MLKVALGRCELEKREALERFLPEEERKFLESIPPFEGDLHGGDLEDLLDKVHWSWFLPTLKLYPQAEQKLFLKALGPYAEKNLLKALTLSANNSEITEIGKSFLRQVLLDSLVGPKAELLPISCLPKSPLSHLLKMTKKELTHLIDQLALYDVAIELRQIVETKILKKLYSLLTSEEKKRLKELGSHKEPFSLGKLGIERWDGSEELLRTLLHKRGLMRFGAALSGQDPDFIWHICHQLDIGRGAQLHKLCKNEAIHGVTDVIIKQVEELL